MGRFANALENGPEYVGAPPTRNAPWHGQSGFAAMGHQVPMFRRAAAQEHLKDMGFTREGDAELRHDIVQRMSIQIERDNSHAAMEVAFEMGLDVTGVYRLLAVLLSAEPTGEDA